MSGVGDIGRSANLGYLPDRFLDGLAVFIFWIISTILVGNQEKMWNE